MSQYFVNGKTSPQETAIEARNLSLCYQDTLAFRDVSLPIYSGRTTALIGPSGCGKTSFLTCINRLTDLIPGCQVSGSLRVGSQELVDNDLDVVALRRRVGMIFQRPNPFPMSIQRNIELPLREHGIEPRQTTESVLRDVGLWDEVKDRLNRSALELSGGQQQRLCIARALALQPQILLLDEPCSSLDPIASGVVEDLITSLHDRYTLVVVTHNLAQARRIADDVALFWVHNGSGSLIEYGEAAHLFESPRDPITASYVSGARG